MKGDYKMELENVLEELKNRKEALMQNAQQLESDINRQIGFMVEDRLKPSSTSKDLQNKNSKLAKSCQELVRLGKELKAIISKLKQTEEKIDTVEADIERERRKATMHDRYFDLSDYKEIIEREGFLKTV